MFKIKIKQKNSDDVKWLLINEGHINFDSGIRFVYQLLDENMNNLEKKLFIINGEDFDKLGLSNEGIRISILKHVLNHLNSEVYLINDN